MPPIRKNPHVAVQAYSLLTAVLNYTHKRSMKLESSTSWKTFAAALERTIMDCQGTKKRSSSNVRGGRYQLRMTLDLVIQSLLYGQVKK
jgi:hypothetical protein